jgi:hypothetical protein
VYSLEEELKKQLLSHERTKEIAIKKIGVSEQCDNWI